ncbi:MAG: AmmeMemoRadiSam system protein B [Candidatus Omnitrophica bacterium]|nr:AmmeMemoRadiSam system protein B [Candidatus Omnitrophota bacterium]MCM8803174.1 AmmeMemoRadiSam system protein B [Candidatus Omnitrophota bacterium]
MKKMFILLYLFSSLIFSQQYRKPAYSGSFYPSKKEELKNQIDSFFKNVNYKEKIEKEKIIGVIAPHAGYIYSGQVASYSFKLLEGMNIKTVILIGRSHHSYFKGAIIDDRDGWETPFGKVEIDKDIFEKLYKKKNFSVNKILMDYEHSLEVEIPFLQYTLKNFKIFPILVGDPSKENTDLITNDLYNVIKERNDWIIVVSTDLSHYYPYELAKQKDLLLLETLKSKNINLIYSYLSAKKIEMCGDSALFILLKIAEKYPDYEVKILNYANSGDTSGEKSKVVGYGSAVVLRKEKKGGNMLTKEQKILLLKIARETLENYLLGKKLPEIKVDDPVLIEKRGVFVTLKKKGELRGCIGYIEGVEPLYLAVRTMAINSAVKDPRFQPVVFEELKDIEIEISVLTVPKRVKSADEIVLGRDGVIVKRGFNQGVFLPQVAEETGWTKEEFLSYLCLHKAGLPQDAWKDPKTELYIFQAEVFSEIEFK